MKNEIIKIAKDLEQGVIDLNTARNLLLNLFNVIGIYSVEDMGKAWSEGYHRKIDEINGNELRYFDVWLANYR